MDATDTGRDGAPDFATPLCGNGIVEPGEACDDGNGRDGCLDGPSGLCQEASCGDGYLDATSEGCEPDAQSADGYWFPVLCSQGRLLLPLGSPISDLRPSAL